MSSTESESISNAEYESLSQRIIMEVQKRPPLYDTTLRPHSDRNTKNMLWEEVYQNVVDNWMKLSQEEKKRKGGIIQKKWKNIRDSFAKELAMRRRKAVIKKKKYVHFDSLQFLIPSLQKRENSRNTDFTSHDTTDAELQELHHTNGNAISPYKQVVIRQSYNEDYDYDEDINFSKMIVPMLRKLNDDQKHFAKVEIMNILQKAKTFTLVEPSCYMQLEWAGTTAEIPPSEIKREVVT